MLRVKKTLMAGLLLVGIFVLAGTTQAASLRLTWVNNSTAATHVRIERCIGVGCVNFTEIATVAGSVSTYTDATLAEVTNANYRVRASIGTPPTDLSGYSNTAGAKTGLNSASGLVVDIP